jgi:hypothetical protein
MAEGRLKTVWEYHRENRIPYPENKPDWVEYAMWYQLCDRIAVYMKKAEGATAIIREFSEHTAAFYEHTANRFLEGHIRATTRDAEQGMPLEAIAEMNCAQPNDPVCVAKWVRDLSPSQSPLPEFRGKEPYPGSGDTTAEIEYFGFKPSRDCSDLTVIRQRLARYLELWRRYPDDLSRVDMREWVILLSDCPWVRLQGLDPTTCEKIMAEVSDLRRKSSHDIPDGKTSIGRYLERRRQAKAAFLSGDWNEAMCLVRTSFYAPVN